MSRQVVRARAGGGLHNGTVAHKNLEKLWLSAQELQEASQNSSMKGERAHVAPPIAEQLLAVVGHRGRESKLSLEV